MTSSNPKKGGARDGAGGPALGGQDAGESRNLIVRLPAQMHDQLDAISSLRGRTKSETVREVLATWLAQIFRD